MGYIFDAMNSSDAGRGGAKPPAASSTQNPQEPRGFSPLLPESGPIRINPGPLSEEQKSVIDDRVVALRDPSSIMAEEYRSIRTGILARWQQKRRLVHTITSATPQEGKTITSVNLGFTFAELRGRRSIVIEADLRLPQFSRLLSLPESPGLVGVLDETSDLNDAIRTVEGSRLHILPAGTRAGNQAVELLGGSTMTTLLRRLRENYDHVIIDTPPVIELADAGIIGGQSDDVFLIARLQRTPRPLIEQAIRTLASYNAPVAGIIATDQQRGIGHYYYYRYGYRYGNRYTAAAA
ncbi:MAG: CpsD/CapB family tyrosine-protein kinase [Planctomycetes bacterium]|nr:CpsD/CapB family tyrosine-protein kinase [Planctomycetota bacterium]